MSCEMADSFTGKSTDGANEWVVVSFLVGCEMDLSLTLLIADVTHILFLFRMNLVMGYQRILVGERHAADGAHKRIVMALNFLRWFDIFSFDKEIVLNA